MNNRFNRTAALVAAATVVLAGCATSGSGPFGERYQTPIPEGSTLVLEQALDVPSGAARVFMQDGRIVPRSLLSGTDRFQPVCSFGLERRGGEPLARTIEPDRFRTGPARNRAYVEAWPEQGVQVAGVSFGVGVGINVGGRRDGGGVGYLTYAVEIPLSSPDQPQVDDFTCEVDRPGNWRGKLGLEAIEQAAGGMVRVELAEGAGSEGSSGY